MGENMSMYKKISWILVVVWMIVIFNLSSQVAKQSDNLSLKVTEVIVETVEEVTHKSIDIDIDILHRYVRKNAHFFAYLLLGVLLLNATESRSKSFVVCLIYAISDEIHQFFVPGRGPQVKDVIIDTSGAILGILIFSFMLICLKNLSKRKLEVIS